jgi:transcriptional regulator with XRE-family HTH domain
MMHTRLLDIIKYKTGGKQTEFAALMGWSPQYLAKLLKGSNFGLQPVLGILTNIPEINARWFLLGDGEMVLDNKYSHIRKTMHETMMKVLDLEKYMPIMSPEELRGFEMVVSGKRKADFSPETVEKWEKLLQDRNDNINAKFKAANSKSNKLCKTKKVLK